MGKCGTCKTPSYVTKGQGIWGHSVKIPPHIEWIQDSFPTCGPVPGFSTVMVEWSRCDQLGQFPGGCRFHLGFSGQIPAGTGATADVVIRSQQPAYPVGMVLDDSLATDEQFFVGAGYRSFDRSIWPDPLQGMVVEFYFDSFSVERCLGGDNPWPKEAPIVTIDDPLILRFLNNDVQTAFDFNGYLIMEVPHRTMQGEYKGDRYAVEPQDAWRVQPKIPPPNVPNGGSTGEPPPTPSVLRPRGGGPMGRMT